MSDLLNKNRCSRIITSNQTGIHHNLAHILEKHIKHDFLKPESRHTVNAFREIEKDVIPLNRPLIFDSGCGVGESTLALAQRFPGHIIIGIDKSAHRLQKNTHYRFDLTANYRLVRADLYDFWRLAVREHWPVDKHFIFYPNPWPLKKDLKKRFHGHPVFPQLLLLGNTIELRSNWLIYLQEFAFAYHYITGKTVVIESFTPVVPETPFERKYLQSGHVLYRLVIENLNFASRSL